MKKTGFTITELLIVVVVVAILAAVTVVAFRGIQQRASLASVRADGASISKKLELFRVDSGLFPASITDCPNPSAGNLCLTPGSGTTVSYFAFNPSVPNRYGAATHTTNPPGYEIIVKSSSQFYYYSTAEITSGNEFVQYVDLAPLIDQYGLRRYQFSFDIKSANTATQTTVNMYMQNGSDTRYTFGAAIPVTTTYQRQTVTLTPVGPNTGVAQSILAFYGVYGSGNRVTVRNMTIQPAL
ncbi:hypothetical protein B7Z00_04705 [Candidatus Saccharibacteria bacterium 32-50-10]|nr:MAG: hypothetical protein B7Z00_04705 [Candidatus Saccharibacteria bacterium 32-50-10]